MFFIQTSVTVTRTFLKTAGEKLNSRENNEPYVTFSGHYFIPIDRAEMIPVEEVCSVRIDDVDPKKKCSTL